MIPTNKLDDFRSFNGSMVAYQHLEANEESWSKTKFGFVIHDSYSRYYYRILDFYRNESQRVVTIIDRRDEWPFKIRKITPYEAEKMQQEVSNKTLFCPEEKEEQLKKLAKRHFSHLMFIFGWQNQKLMLSTLPKEIVRFIIILSSSL